MGVGSLTTGKFVVIVGSSDASAVSKSLMFQLQAKECSAYLMVAGFTVEAAEKAVFIFSPLSETDEEFRKAFDQVVKQGKVIPVIIPGGKLPAIIADLRAIQLSGAIFSLQDQSQVNLLATALQRYLS